MEFEKRMVLKKVAKENGPFLLDHVILYI